MPRSAMTEFREPPSRVSITWVLGIYVVLLTVIPARMVWKPLGALGMPSAVFAAMAFFIWAIAVLMPEPLVVRTSVPVRSAIVGMWLATLASFAVMHRHVVPGLEVNSADRYLVFLLGWSAVAFLIAEVTSSADALRNLVSVTVWSAAFVAAVGVMQFYTGFDLTRYLIKIPGLQANGDYVAVLSRASFRRPSGTATHPIEMACVVAMALPLSIHRGLHFGGTMLRRWGPVVPLALAVPVAVSRSALLGAIAGGAVYFIGLDGKTRLRGLGIAALMLPFVFMTSPGLLGTLKTLVFGAPSDDSITTRTSDYAVVARLLRNSPIVGRGPDTFLASYRILDNEYLLTLVNLGIFGLICTLIFFATTIGLGRGVRQRTSDAATRDLGQALAASGAVVLVSGMAFDSMTFPMFAGFVPVYLGLAGAAWGLVREGRLGVPAADTGKFIRFRSDDRSALAGAR